MSLELLTSLKLFGPELIIVGVLIVLFLVDAFAPRSRDSFVPLVFTLLGCLVAAFLASQFFSLPRTSFFSGAVINDSFGNFFRYFFFFTTASCAYLSFGSKELASRNRMEFCILLLCITFGLCLMATATHLLILYIGIETVSIISFVLAGFHKDNLKSNEASFKYLIFGIMASGFMLYGFSLLYGLAGSLRYADIALYFQQAQDLSPILVGVIVTMIYCGLAYKISAFPMHFWTPDVYEGAPTPVVTFFSVAPKAAGFAALIRLFVEFFSVPNILGQWSISAWGAALVPGIAVISAATMFIGNLCAISQKSVKRMLAYSSIAQVGYMLMGFVSLDLFGFEAILFYLIAYCAMNMGAFWVVCIVCDQKGHDKIDAFQGTGWSMPILGVCMTIFLLSLAGIPVFSGFIGKFWLFGAVIKTPGYLWLALFGVINSVISLYYYARILRAMWLEGPEPASTSQLSFYHAVALIGLAVPTVVLGLYFAPVIHFVERSLWAFM